MKDPEVMQLFVPFEAEFGVVHEVRDHQRARIKAKFCVVGVLQGRC